MRAKSERAELQFETLEDRQLLAGTVEVSVVDGVLLITGDAGANHVTVTQLENGQYVVQGTATRITIAGEPEGVEQNGLTEVIIDSGLVLSINVDLGEGSNTLLASDITLPPPVEDSGFLNIASGAGSDFVFLSNVVLPASLTADLGEGDDTFVALNTTTGAADLNLGGGINQILLVETGVANELLISTGISETPEDTPPEEPLPELPTLPEGIAFSNVVIGIGLDVGAQTQVETGNGNDLVHLTGEFGDDVQLDLGGAFDLAILQGTFAGGLSINGGSGIDTSILLPFTDFDEFDLNDIEFDFDFNLRFNS